MPMTFSSSQYSRCYDWIYGHGYGPEYGGRHYAGTFWNGTAATATFNKGNLLDYKETSTNLPNGTTVEFIPDKEVYKNITA